MPDEYHFAKGYDSQKIAEVDEAVASVHEAVGPSEFGVENEGYLYILALLTEIMQQGDEWKWGPSHTTTPGIADPDGDQ